MQEINELKNIVVQSLEANGVLSQLRAQIRASVFKIIDMQESQQKRGGSCFYWENELCQKIHEMEDGVKCLELIAEFLQFFKMDYTQSVFVHEGNLKADVKREQLIEKLGLPSKSIDAKKPLLMNLFALMKGNQGEIGSSGIQQIPEQKEKRPQTQQQKQPIDTEKLFNELEKELQISETKPKQQQQQKKQDDLADIQQKKSQKIDQQQQQDLKKQQQQMKEKEEQAKREEQEKKEKDKQEQARKEKEKLDQARKEKEKQEQAKREKEKQEQAKKEKEKQDQLQKQKELQQAQEEAEKQKQAEMQQFESSGDYENEIDEEELMKQQQQQMAEQQEQQGQQFGESEEGVGHSQGFDMSIDSMALEEYDHIEDIIPPSEFEDSQN